MQTTQFYRIHIDVVSWFSNSITEFPPDLAPFSAFSLSLLPVHVFLWQQSESVMELLKTFHRYFSFAYKHTRMFNVSSTCIWYYDAALRFANILRKRCRQGPAVFRCIITMTLLSFFFLSFHCIFVGCILCCFFCCRFHHIQMHSQGKWIKCTDWKFAIQCKIVCAWKRQLLWPKWMKIKRAKHLIEQIEVCDKLRIVLFDVVEPITFKFKVPTFLKRWRFVLFTAAVTVCRSWYCSICWKFLRCLQWHFISSTKIDRASKIQQ